MEKLYITPIGTVQNQNGNFSIDVAEKYRPALEGLDAFGHIQVYWWADENDNAESRNRLSEKSPYKGSPDTLGTFATRSPFRPNPIAMTVCAVAGVDAENGRISFFYIDAEDGTPVIDLKPYHPSSDRVENPIMPVWCADWPDSLEASAVFDWENSDIFNF